MALIDELLHGTGIKTCLPIIFPVSLIVCHLSWIIYTRTIHPIAKVPGDFWPSVSQKWHMYRIYRGGLTDRMRDMHERYGPLVRIAPNEVLSADPEAIAKIHPTQHKNEHSEYRNIVGGVYTMTSVLKNEYMLDEVLNLFVRRLDKFTDAKKPFDFGSALYSWAGQFGFLESGSDYGNFMQASHLAFPFSAIISVAPRYLWPFLLI
ncbi:hypothetical protein P153DRAFT_387883 [Dothidotthia symphoricarpi CBS 119687]|uniref:Cytochrome P450 n=1 Tax=Dothidotthia symphoricarpi CBS 119687 TaxID=1392245 RepID=A0A6A6A627_9PLEO|nr:uncharacterized protein P153DRAFT_387883 [Dothidotthia symphoricarpi CBS 119687]KAF2127339.1 hypothetical protein P153DRAFT_387883 [Dothidotthia symphoricarpi CBS 119687]